ncbi:hypothetical protein MASR1M32_08800 [Rhodobacter sp.]
MRRIFLVLPLALLACVETAPVKPQEWKLVALNRQPFLATATLSLDQSGDRAFGRAPCNSWSGRVVKDPFPTWAIRDVTSTEMACADLSAEQAFLAALARATHMAVTTQSLTLTGGQGLRMDFIPAGSP